MMFLVPPGPPTMTLSQDVWIENQTYTATCSSSQGNPANIYTWSLDNVNSAYTVNINRVRAKKGQRVIRCSVTNKFTIDKRTERSASRDLTVHCKFILMSCIIKGL